MGTLRFFPCAVLVVIMTICSVAPGLAFKAVDGLPLITVPVRVEGQWVILSVHYGYEEAEPVVKKLEVGARAERGAPFEAVPHDSVTYRRAVEEFQLLAAACSEVVSAQEETLPVPDEPIALLGTEVVEDEASGDVAIGQGLKAGAPIVPEPINLTGPEIKSFGAVQATGYEVRPLEGDPTKREVIFYVPLEYLVSKNHNKTLIRDNMARAAADPHRFVSGSSQRDVRSEEMSWTRKKSDQPGLLEFRGVYSLRTRLPSESPYMNEMTSSNF